MRRAGSGSAPCSRRKLLKPEMAAVAMDCMEPERSRIKRISVCFEFMVVRF